MAFLQLLGDVVVTVDQRRLPEDAVDPRLDLWVDRLLGLSGGAQAVRREAKLNASIQTLRSWKPEALREQGQAGCGGSVAAVRCAGRRGRSPAMPNPLKCK